MTIARTLLLALALAICLVPTAAQELVYIPRLEGVVTLDGASREPVWREARPLPLVMNMPTYGATPSERTDLLIGYDDLYLYVAARCYSEPGGVRGTSFKRDIATPGIDYVGILLDTYDDNENGLAFWVTPTGARVDFTVFNDAQGEPPINLSWDTFWDAAVEQTDKGWFAEMRIPFTSLRFQDTEGHVRMGLIAFRWTARKAEIVSFPDIEPKWGFWSFHKPSQAQDVAFDGVYSQKPLYVAPYALAGVSQDFHLNPAETAYRRVDDPTYDVGLDVKYGLTSNLTLDLTVNTDFAQVEADDQQINLTRFSLFFPEKRLFFQERASIFDFGMPEPATAMDPLTFSTSRLFYSRRIGLYESHPVRILGGARAVGRVGEWDLGFIGMQTARAPGLLESGGALPSENFGVLRLRRQLLNRYSYTGLMTTSRIGMDGRYNVAYGVDGLLRLFGDDYLSIDWSQTFDDNIEPAGLFEQARVQARWERRTFSGIGYALSASRSGASYTPGVGFLLRDDYVRFGDRVFYGWTPGERSRLQSHQISLRGAAFLRNSDGSVESVEFGPAWQARMKSGTELYVTGVSSYENVREAFSLSDAAEVPVGSYRFHEVRGRLSTPSAHTVSATITASGGSFFDGRRSSAGVLPVWIVSPRLELSGFYGIDRIVFPGRDVAFTAHLGRLRVQAALNTRVSAAAFIQFNSTLDAVVTNIRLRYNPREGVDFYLVYNEGLNTDRYRDLPVLPLTSARTVLAKYTYTFPL